MDAGTILGAMAEKRKAVKPGRTTPQGPPPSARYTPPVPREQKVSSRWVPILMFTFLALGMVMIVFNYLNLLPGDDPSNWYLLGGLGLITMGFVVATRWR